MNLVETLTAETQSLKAQFIEMTAKWAEKDFASIKGLAETPHPKYDDFTSPGWTPAVNNGWSTSPSGQKAIDYQKGIRYRKAVDRRHAAQQIVSKGLEAYVEKQKKLAELHYESSIIKLAARIEKKGLNQEALSVATAHIGVNIDTTLTDGQMTVRAFTIIASGPVQRPHYRYLIK